MFEIITNLFRSTPTNGPAHLMQRESRYDDGSLPRSWDAAVDTEENAHQWACADGRTINEILVDHYETIAFRSRKEAQRNPTVEGVIKTHGSDIVGDEGPGLQMLSDDDKWNEQAESIWNEISHAIDGSGKLSVGEWLRQDIYQSWVTGDMICQIVDDQDADGLIKTRIHPVSGLRLKSPMLGNADTMLGIERNRLNRPTRYWFEDEVRSEAGFRSYNLTPVPARDVLHFFEELEPGQVRGWPRLASCLQAISDLREFDNSVLDAAKVQAMMSVLMYSNSDMIQPEDATAELKLKRMGITKIPDGYTATAMATSQSSANNTDFRNERSRELGRPASMPLMQIRLDSSGHNYASARFDAQNYQKANRVIQGSLGRHRVYPVVHLVLTEAMRKGMLTPKPILRKMVRFRWPQPPHVDPVKEAMAERIRLENRTLSPQLAAQSHNLDFDHVAKDWALANKILEKNGMPQMLGGLPIDLNALMTYLGTNPEEEASNGKQNTTSA